jgi:DNA-binding SARP family transcriptional activator
LVTSFKSNKVRALLAYLAVEVDRPHRREVLAGLLWLKWPDQDALSNLRYALSDLRQAIGDHSTQFPFPPRLQMIKVFFCCPAGTIERR